MADTAPPWMIERHHLRLSEGESELAFVPHDGGRANTATFDVTTKNVDCLTVGAESRICANIDRPTATNLRDAINAWLAQPCAEGVTG